MKNNLLKKFFAAFFVMTISLAMLAGCGGLSEKTGGTQKSDKSGGISDWQTDSDNDTEESDEEQNKAKDLRTLSAWNTCAVSAYYKAADNVDASETYVLVISGDAITVRGVTNSTSAPGADSMQKYFIVLSGLDESGCDFSSSMRSESGRNIDHVEFTIDGSSGTSMIEAFSESGDYLFDPIYNR